MNLAHFPPATFEVLAGSAARDRLAGIAAELNRHGHRLTSYGRPDPEEEEWRDYTDPNRCATRLAVRVEVAVTAGYRDARVEGDWGEQM